MGSNSNFDQHPVLDAVIWRNVFYEILYFWGFMRVVVTFVRLTLLYVVSYFVVMFI